MSLKDETPEVAQEDARTLLAAVVDSSDDVIITKTLQGVITSWNSSATRLFGYTAAEAIGQPITMLIPEDRLDEEKGIIESLSAGHRIEHYETVRVTKDGRLLDVALTISPIRNSAGDVIGASKILRDITDRKRIDRALRDLLTERERLLESERAARSQAEHLSATKDEFLAMLSHELRTPLSAILGWTQILRRDAPASSDLATGLGVIERNVRVQAQLVEDLLDMSRVISGQMRLDVQPIMPYTAVQGAIESARPAADARGLRLETILDPAAGPVSGDSFRLQQVVWNLISNAIKFTPKGGRVRVVMQRTDSHVDISVADSGTGIHPDFLPHVFERFRQADASTTRQYQGLGLGLSIVKHIVELHGGRVSASSEGEGRGATFLVELPVAILRPRVLMRGAPPTVEQQVLSLPATADLSNLLVVVVDDEADARELLRRVLSDRGATVVATASAEEALVAIEKHSPDVLISDIGMPKIDGYELMRRLKGLNERLGRRFPAIALTAFARSEDRTRALLAGFAAHISKPVDAAELIANIAAVTGRIS